MARLGRYFLPDQPQHVIQRGNNRAQVFFAEADYRFYLDCLNEAAGQYVCAIHAYVLMTNHVHLLVSPAYAQSMPRMLQSLGRRYVRHINLRLGRTGTLWEGRYRATVIDSERYLLACMRYIELNPVRAGMVVQPADYPWSSHRHYIGRTTDPLVIEHPIYRALGGTTAARRVAYRDLCRRALAAETVEAFRLATNAGWALGDERFRSRIEASAGRRAAPLSKGRPRRVELIDSDPN